ncbi:casein kinase substrate phospho protein PP28-domain-containing protein [Coniochaeta sp. 2T2.1]|nr:casein kinase substrate phospho protein PP28-domain-containing protein [Coniochaeta sp. 2T2.1]
MAGGSGAPGGNSRGRGGKFKKYTRGGGKHFSRDLRPLDADGNEISMWAPGAQKKKDDESSEEESSEEESSEEESDDGNNASSAAAALSREERKKEKAAKKAAAVARAKAASIQVGDLPPSESEEEDSDDDDDAPMPANPNHSKAARSQTKVVAQTSKAVDDVTERVKKVAVSGGSMNRKEREAAEKAEAAERYRKLHEAGKTDEAKADLARLRLIREKREQEAARKQAEKEEREADAAAKKAEIDAKEAKKREAAMGPAAKGKGKSKK